MLIVSDELVVALEELLQKKMNEDEMHDELVEVLDIYCKDAYTRGYLEHKLEVDSNSLMARQLVNEMLYFAKRIQEINNY